MRSREQTSRNRPLEPLAGGRAGPSRRFCLLQRSISEPLISTYFYVFSWLLGRPFLPTCLLSSVRRNARGIRDRKCYRKPTNLLAAASLLATLDSRTRYVKMLTAPSSTGVGSFLSSNARRGWKRKGGQTRNRPRATTETEGDPAAGAGSEMGSQVAAELNRKGMNIAPTRYILRSCSASLSADTPCQPPKKSPLRRSIQRNEQKAGPPSRPDGLVGFREP